MGPFLYYSLMPRIARVVAVGYPHHITQRGNNKAVVFFDDEDRLYYCNTLTKYSKKYQLEIWAYCLMGNHVHLLALPKKKRLTCQRDRFDQSGIYTIFEPEAQ